MADRFAVFENGRVIDLATAEAVVLRVSAAGGVTEQARWMVRCDALYTLHHPAIARLVDWGIVGEGQRLEAWRCGPEWNGARAAAKAALVEATAFLSACGLTPGTPSLEQVRSSPAGAVMLPGFEAGYPSDASATTSSRRLELPGIRLQSRPALAVLTDLCEEQAHVRPRAIAVCGAAGAGKTTTLFEAARIARANGLVPTAASLLSHPIVSDALVGRSLLVIDDGAAVDGSKGRAGWCAWLDASLRSPRPHVLLIASEEGEPTLDSVRLGQCSTESLVAAVQPLELSAALRARVRRAAERAHGNPGSFARLLWRQPSTAGARILVAAEQQAEYSTSERPREAPALCAPPACVWPAPGELATLRRRMATARQHLQDGRHAAGERLLREAIGALARRDDWTSAGEGALALAGSLLTRGRPRDSLDVLDLARQYGRRAALEPSLVDVATLSGTAWTDLARLDDAESVLSGAIASARSQADRGRVDRARLALARCLFWRGAYAEADHLVAEIEPDGQSDTLAIRLDATASRIAVGLRDLARGVARAAEAVERARRAARPGILAEAACSLAFVHLAVGDLDAVGRDVAEAVAAAHEAREGLSAVRAQLILAECARRQRRPGVARTLLGRLNRISTARLPPIVQARCALGKDLLSGADTREATGRLVAATGLHALALFAPSTSPVPPGIADSGLEDVLEILSGCQNAEDEVAILQDVCNRLRRRLHAAAVAVVGIAGPSRTTLACTGSRIDSAIADRVAVAGIAIAPHLHEGRIEGGSPVRYGGTTIGALVARWTVGSSRDFSNATAVLTLAAAAAAPAVSAALGRGHQVRSPGVGELMGVSPAIADLRHIVERAAGAPFPVLVEGESGSGKELVARAIHRHGPRRQMPFCALNCAALPDDLVESELFGHARGAFTGAAGERPGVFEEAHGGTLFLDEVGELSLRAQAKLLRVIQDGELRRVGENVSRRVDVRIVSATNRDLVQEVAAARFRDDLLYRLNVIRIALPPLRERREDIALLAERSWQDAATRVGSRATLAMATVAALARYDWPGNVRELQNVLAALAVRSPKRGVVPPTALPPQFAESRHARTWRLDDARRTFEERFVKAALVRAGGHRAQASVELGLTRQGLTKLMARLGISSD